MFLPEHLHKEQDQEHVTLQTACHVEVWNKEIRYKHIYLKLETQNRNPLCDSN